MKHHGTATVQSEVTAIPANVGVTATQTEVSTANAPQTQESQATAAQS